VREKESAIRAGNQTSLGDVLLAQGNKAGAKQNYEQALQFQQSLGQKGNAAYSQMLLAALALEEKKPEMRRSLRKRR
jgi:predicted negative regulator of RcsB-dependent stress response